jgi:dTDP-glucose 4,6-dehydratase
MKKTILITGVCGFIGSNMIRTVIEQYPQYRFVGVDRLDEVINVKNIFKHNNYTFYSGDISDFIFMNTVFRYEKPSIVIHMAAHSFVDTSIENAKPFINSNVLGTQTIIDLCVKYQVEKLLYSSTDEIYGSLKEGDKSWTEESHPKPRNPYSASKYCGESLIYAANQTHGLNYLITRSCNNYGKLQASRNLIPKLILNTIHNTPVSLHNNGTPMREWIYVLDKVSAIMTILEKSPLNEVYNIGTGIEIKNINLAHKIGKSLGKEPNLLFGEDRPGQDMRYSVNCDKLKSLGWKPKYDFDQSLINTIHWYIENNKYYD